MTLKTAEKNLAFLETFLKEDPGDRSYLQNQDSAWVLSLTPYAFWPDYSID